LDVGQLVLPRAHERGTHRARPFALRPEHVAVDDQRLLVAEQIGERRRSPFTLEYIILFALAARRQGAALLGDTLDVAAKLDLFRQQRLAGTAIFGAFIGKPKIAGARELGGG